MIYADYVIVPPGRMLLWRNYNIMRIPFFPAESIRSWLRTHKVAALPELKQALGTEVSMTVFRKLRELGYHSSYSHRGQYYTLDEIARFDERGLWSHQGIWFSRHGSLLNSAEAFVQISEAGYFSHELEDLLHVSVKEALLQLVSQRRLTRETLSHRFLYCSSEPALRKQQLLARRMLQAQPPWPGGSPLPEAVSQEAKAGIVLFFSLLDEQQRRLYAGLQALLLGHGGDQQIAELLGLDPHTVAKGRRQLIEQDVLVDRTRRSGGGRKPVEKKPRK
jgi:hypothetical protein